MHNTHSFCVVQLKPDVCNVLRVTLVKEPRYYVTGQPGEIFSRVKLSGDTQQSWRDTTDLHLHVCGMGDRVTN